MLTENLHKQDEIGTFKIRTKHKSSLYESIQRLKCHSAQRYFPELESTACVLTPNTYLSEK